MRIYQLEGFYYVGRTGGYSKAARAMPYPVGEPAVHQQVKALQEDLAVKLVERVRGGGVQLTPEGRALHAFVAPFFEGLPGLDRGLRGGAAGRVILAAPRIILTDWLPSRLARLRKRFPSVAWQLIEQNDNAKLVPMLLRGEADLAINFLPTIPPALAHHPVTAFEVVAAVPAGHPLARRSQAALPALAALPLITYERGSVPRLLLDEALSRARLSPVIAIETTTSEAMLHYVAQGCGVALVPCVRDRPAAARASGASGTRSPAKGAPPPGVRLLSLPGFLPPQPVSLAYRKASASPLLANLVAALLKKK